MANSIGKRAQDLIASEERKLAVKEFHRRMRRLGDLGHVLEELVSDVKGGALDENLAAAICEEAILMSRPLYPIGIGKSALESLREQNPDAATEAERRIAALHRDIAGPEDLGSRNHLTELQLDPLRALYETIDVDLAREIREASSSNADVPTCVRAQVIALADHFQRCQYLSGSLIANWLLARQNGKPLTITTAEMEAITFLSRNIITPVQMDPRSAETLRDALNARTRATQTAVRIMSGKLSRNLRTA